MGSGLLPAPCGDGIGAAPGALRRWDRGCSRRPAEMGSGLLPAPCGDGIGAAPGALRRWDRGCSRRPAEMGSGLLPAPCGDGIGAAPGALRRSDQGCSRRCAVSEALSTLRLMELNDEKRLAQLHIEHRILAFSAPCSKCQGRSE
ncbi:uncharacterized protein [Taeniopygia guttata]|uniref:uncharacterized protein isoform X5 n=1 Tax=Taeniopygia guttata TaxID=59729 RepID=UPI003BB88834